jgi:hypothetical protein
MIALVVQILAPIAACWAAGLVISDPLAAAVICRDNSAQTNGGSDQTGGHRAHDGSCSLCCAAHAVAAADTPQATVPAPYHQSALPVLWHDAAVTLPGSRAGSHAQARAPPSFS